MYGAKTLRLAHAIYARNLAVRNGAVAHVAHGKAMVSRIETLGKLAARDRRVQFGARGRVHSDGGVVGVGGVAHLVPLSIGGWCVAPLYRFWGVVNSRNTKHHNIYTNGIRQREL